MTELQQLSDVSQAYNQGFRDAADTFMSLSLFVISGIAIHIGISILAHAKLSSVVARWTRKRSARKGGPSDAI